ncbi:MAG: hypothetical protein HN380_14390 [Victivallales bacterium]|nr:hypothetical protein [Victivallales bacterium]
MMKWVRNPAALRLSLALCLGIASLVGGAEPRRIALTVRLGATDEESTVWDGELRCPDGMVVENAVVLDLYPWGKRANIKVPSPMRVVWKGSSKRDQMRDYFKKRPVIDLKGVAVYYPLKPYSFVVEFTATEWAPVTISTAAHGEFQVDPRAVSYDQPATFLDGRVHIERSLPGTELGTCRAADGAILYNDFPALCAAADGATWTAYVAYRGRPNVRVSLEKDPKNFAPLQQVPCNDQLLVVREQARVAGEAMPITAGGLDLFHPAIAARDGAGPLVVWSQRTGQNWDLHASVRTGNKWSKPIQLTSAPGPDLYAVLVATDQGYWLAWQSFRQGTSRIMLARIDPEALKLDAPIEVTDGTANCWMPAIAADSRGRIAVAYDTYAKGDYDVYCAFLGAGSNQPTQVPVATSLRFEDRASIAFDAQDRLWIAWEETGRNWGKDTGGNAAVKRVPGERIDDGRTLRVACIEEGKLRLPKASLDPLLPLQQTIMTVYGKPKRARERIFTEEKRYAYYPRLAVTADGRICLAFRQHDYLPNLALAHQGIWSDFVTMLDGDHWLPPTRLLGSSGHRHCAPVICALPAGGVAVAGAGDGRASGQRKKCEANQNIRLGRYVPTGKSRSPVLEPAVAVVPPEVPPSVAAEREAVQRMRTFRATVGGKTYRILRGDFHRHTAFSGDSALGDGSIDDAFRYALDAAALDTMGNGDHDNGSGFEYPWYITQKFYDLYLMQNHFIPMFSYERSVTANGPQGHKNIIMPRRGMRVLPVHGRDNIDEKGSIQDTRLLFQFLREQKFVSIPHTIGTGAGGNFVDRAPDVNCVVEIYQGARNSYEYADCPRGNKRGNTPGFYWSLLKANQKFGIIASSDHRSTHVSYAMLYVSEMSREGVMEALRRRHCYGATDNILLDVRIGTEHMMGDELKANDAPKLRIHAVGTGPIKSLDIIRNAEIYHTISPGKATVDVTWQDPAPVPGESSYYVRVIQEDGELAWGTPLWVRRP